MIVELGSQHPCCATLIDRREFGQESEDSEYRPSDADAAVAVDYSSYWKMTVGKMDPSPHGFPDMSKAGMPDLQDPTGGVYPGMMDPRSMGGMMPPQAMMGLRPPQDFRRPGEGESVEGDGGQGEGKGQMSSTLVAILSGECLTAVVLYFVICRV